MIYDDLKLCLVTHRQHQSFDEYLSFILRAVDGGVTSVQLRDKHASLSELKDMALALKSHLTPRHIPLIINDHIELAKAVNADGVHLGQSDCAPEKARELLGDTVYIGLSIETMDHLTHANDLACLDYVAASAVFSSQTKIDCATIWGLDGLSLVCAQSQHPVVAIGGITKHNVDAVMACGVIGVAVVNAIHEASCPEHAAREFVQQQMTLAHFCEKSCY
jgi:thiamine-phosphate pyrophosphorylase